MPRFPRNMQICIKFRTPFVTLDKMWRTALERYESPIIVEEIRTEISKVISGSCYGWVIRAGGKKKKNEHPINTLTKKKKWPIWVAYDINII